MSMPNDHVRILVIVGPTAVGKTETSILVAERMNGEIISADSRQIYRRMDIGTAKPEPEYLARVPHHLIDVVDPSDEFNAVEFARLAREAISDIHARDRYPIVVGGSGLYIRALLEGLFLGPPASPKVRAQLHQVVAEMGSSELHARLSEVDPDAAAKIHPNDVVRIVRAMEVFMLTGDPISRLRERMSEDDPLLDPTIVGLTRDRDALYVRINQRVDQMMEDGFEDEVRQLLKEGGGDERSWDAVGYREIASAIREEISMEDAVEQVKMNSRRYAKRQMTWFSKDSRIQWIVLTPESTPEAVADEIVGIVRGPDKT
jgi:tRNA dimethylallyltransferase